MLSSADRDTLQLQAIDRWLAKSRSDRTAAKETERWRLEPRAEPEPLPRPPAPTLVLSEWMTVNETAALLGVHPQTVYVWITAGRLPCGRTPGGRIRIARASVVT